VRPALAARRAAEAVRALNHATLSGSGYVWPGDVDDVIGELQTLAERLPQALGQAVRFLEDAHGAGRVGHDTDPAAVGVAVAELVGDLDRAGRDVAELAASLRCARANSCHLTGIGHDSNEHEDEDDNEDRDDDGGRR
jgi:hypothetical protein